MSGNGKDINRFISILQNDNGKAIAPIQQGINYEYSSSKGLWPLSEQTCHAHFPVFLQEGSDYPPPKKISWLYKFLYKVFARINLIDIPLDTEIGGGLVFGHAFNVTVNGSAVLGEYVDLEKNVTIGREKRGKRKGCPVIGNRVWIGTNATVVGKISIGDDVLIAPNAYVNCDVPSHSVVIGNPCVIHHRDNATEEYIN